MGTPVLNKSEVFTLIGIIVSLLGVIVGVLGVIEFRRRRRPSGTASDEEDRDTAKNPRIQPPPHNLNNRTTAGTIRDTSEAAVVGNISSPPYSLQGSSQSRLNEHPSQQ